MGKDFVINEFYCNKEENVRIFAKEYLPEGINSEVNISDKREASTKNDPMAQKLPTMILCHGFGGDCDELDRECSHFASIGFAVYTFDFCGGSAPGRGGRSDGTDIKMTIRSETEDLLCIFEYIKKLSYIDNEHITFMGFSQGGFIANLAAAKCPEEVENLILVYPALCIPDHARLGCLGGASFETNVAPEKIECPNGMTLGKQFFYQASYLDPYKEMAFFKGNVLIIHGEMDEIVNCSYSVKASQSFFSANKCHIMLVRSAGHGFDDAITESLFIAVENFIAGKNELLNIQVFVTDVKNKTSENGDECTDIYFTGYCDNEYFRGAISPIGVDNQTRLPGGELKLHADYTLTGLDFEGKSCNIHIINEKKGDRFKPVALTDSKALEFINDADLTAALEGFDGGLTVRIWG
ncbi:MAG: lysophospholipase [Butyrivibrio sp.]|nr:lysophospholipase [Butyrivibrio sp.]